MKCHHCDRPWPTDEERELRARVEALAAEVRSLRADLETATREHAETRARLVEAQVGAKRDREIGEVLLRLLTPEQDARLREAVAAVRGGG